MNCESHSEGNSFVSTRKGLDVSRPEASPPNLNYTAGVNLPRVQSLAKLLETVNRYGNTFASKRPELDMGNPEEETTDPGDAATETVETHSDPEKALVEEHNSREADDMKGASKQNAGRAIGNPRKVFVGNISFEVRSRELKSFFGSFGKVKHVQLLWDKGRGKFKGSAFVMFCTVEGALAAKSASEGERTLDGRVMTVVAAEGRSRKPKMGAALHVSEMNHEVDINHERELGVDVDHKQDLEATQRRNLNHAQRVEADLGMMSISSPDDSPIDCDQSVAGTLPEDVLMQVFSYLRVDDRIRMERVCRRWRHIALHSWQSVRKLHFENVFQGLFAKGKHSLTHSILKSILKRGCENLQYLDVSASPRLLNAHSAELIGRKCPNLTHLDLSGMRIDKHGIRQLSSLCKRLKRVELRRCLEISEEGFWWLFKNSENLEYFDGRENLRITGQCFYMLNPGCHTVIVEECNNLRDMGIKRLTDKCPGLRVLNISKCYQLTGVSLQRIAENFHSLVKLSLNGDYPSVSSESLYRLGQLSSLQELHLKDNLNVTDDVLLRLSNGCSNLRVLDISGCYKQVSSVGLACLSACTQLSDINISYIDSVCDAEVKTLALQCPLNRVAAKSCPEITDEVLTVMGNHCTTLEEVDFSGCEGITDEGVAVFVKVREDLDMRENSPIVHLILGGTSVSDTLPSSLPSPEVCGVEVSLLDLSVPQHRLELESYGRFFPSDDEEEEWGSDAEPTDEHQAVGQVPPQPFHREESDRPDPSNIPPPDHSHHLEELGVDSMDEWNYQRQMHYGVADGYAMPEDYAEDFLDADDPSLWEDEFFVT